jgi:hypothetical protein
MISLDYYIENKQFIRIFNAFIINLFQIMYKYKF